MDGLFYKRPSAMKAGASRSSVRAKRKDSGKSVVDGAGQVCFIGSCLNDSIALKQANVSISLRGASSAVARPLHGKAQRGKTVSFDFFWSWYILPSPLFRDRNRFGRSSCNNAAWKHVAS